MGNMSYCRFQNTAEDLQDCYDHMDEKLCDLGDGESQGRKDIIRLCIVIADEFGDEVDG